MRSVTLLLFLLLVAVCSVLFSLLSGSVETGTAALLDVIRGDAGTVTRQVVLELRWPRTAAAFVTGALLALAGALMQVLLRNPLADPYVLGISGGAATGALLAMLLGLGNWWLQGSAFAGALLSMLLVFGLAHGSGAWSTHRLLLTGVVVAAGWGAVIAFLLAISPDHSLRGMLFWLMGDLSYAELPSWAIAVLALVFLATIGLSRSLNVLAMGETTARLLGEPTRKLLWLIYLLASVLTLSLIHI